MQKTSSLFAGQQLEVGLILDATDLAQPVLSAATMATVLLALQEKASLVPIEFELVFDPETASYQFKNDSTSMPPIRPMHIVK